MIYLIVNVGMSMFQPTELKAQQQYVSFESYSQHCTDKDKEFDECDVTK